MAEIALDLSSKYENPFSLFMLLSLFSVILCASALLAMAFYTLLERKLLAYAQLRKGPNKVGFLGLLQPFADAIKLFTKEGVLPSYSNKFLFSIAPSVGLALALLCWHLYPLQHPIYFFTYGALLLFSISSLRVYVTLIAG